MTELPAGNIAPRPVKLRVEDYLLLDDAGAFENYNRTELLDGKIVFMNAQHRPHARVKTELGFRLRQRLAEIGSDLTVFFEASVSMPPHNVPEPDILLTSAPYGEGLVPIGSIALIVEVADATLKSDLKRKAEIYARNGVPEYWVVDVKGRSLHQMATSDGRTYGKRQESSFADPIQALTMPQLVVDLANVS